MKKNILKKEIFIYSINDDKNIPIIKLFFLVNFIEIEEQKYLENDKTSILIETNDFDEGKKVFSDIINEKVRNSIMSNNFYTLLKMWNFKQDSELNIVNELNKELNIIEDSFKINYNNQMKYSSAMINRFDETSNWKVK